MKAMLTFIEKMTLEPDRLAPADGQVLRDAGVSAQAATDAIGVALCFNLIDRLADSFAFEVPEPEGLREGRPGDAQTRLQPVTGARQAGSETPQDRQTTHSRAGVFHGKVGPYVEAITS